MKEVIIAFVKGLIPYDYALFGAIFILFLLFIVFALLFRRKLVVSLFFILLGFITLFVGPVVGYVELHNYLFKNSTKLLSQKRLKFSKAVVIYGSLTNESKKDFKECEITANIYAVTGNKYRNYLKKFKPFMKTSILEQDIMLSQTKKFQIIVEPFTHKGDYNISLGAECK